MPIQVSCKIMKGNHTKGLCSTCPILSSEASILNTMDFEIGCGSDNKCTAKINLDIKSNLTTIIEGFNNEFQLLINVRNEEENAYSTKLQLIIKPIIEFIQLNSRCVSDEQLDSLLIKCDIDNPLEKDDQKLINFYFATNYLQSNSTEISVYGEVITSSELDETSQSKVNYSIPIKRYASIHVFKDPTPNEILYDDLKVNSNDYVKYSTRIHLDKDNYSSIYEIELKLKIPSNYTNQQPIAYLPLIKLITKPTKSASIKCDTSSMYLPSLPGEQHNDDVKKSSSVDKSVDTTRAKREIHHHHQQQQSEFNISKEEANAFKLVS
ncbi:integrin alpha-PS2-like isoform X2 [Leptotrombidium deliense]|uniref:Integrin alpha-PS2-like isoform X2 n=1 Tax=Leptotrombidium deliense TaxID=299467 RepID=A0A443S844_9ACAR|nr:integrin alpha-PS2-like isoform X2 [Leptotrombidium deliense]